MRLSTWWEDFILSDAGVIDKSAILAFTRGHCHSLALALNKLTGWVIYGLVDEMRGDIPTSPSHVVVKRPDGEFVDIEGPGALRRWKQHGYWDSVPMKLTPTQAQHLDAYLKPEVDAAMPFAYTLVNTPHVNPQRTVRPQQLPIAF